MDEPMTDLARKHAQQLFFRLYGGKPANELDHEIGREMLYVFAAAIREAVEVDRNRDGFKVFEEAKADARRDAIREFASAVEASIERCDMSGLSALLAEGVGRMSDSPLELLHGSDSSQPDDSGGASRCEDSGGT